MKEVQKREREEREEGELGYKLNELCMYTFKLCNFSDQFPNALSLLHQNSNFLISILYGDFKPLSCVA
jgi:hypothetical protein